MSALELPDHQLERLADLIAARLQSPAAGVGLVDAQQLADHLGVARSFVYQHSDELGGKRLGKRGRLRFDLATASAAFASSQQENTTTSAPRRRRQPTGDVGSILQVRG